MPSRAVRLVPALLLLLWVAPGSPAAPVQRSPDPRADSIRALRSARSAQASFERLRFRHLPWAWGGGSGPCEERIGRFCLWHSEGGKEWVPPPEEEAVQRGREELIERLDSAALRALGDGWIAGQRVRYLLEAGRAEEALMAVEGCRAEGGWCRALEGLALHAAGEYAAADSAFAAALAAMPEKERAEWTELGPLLPDGEWRALRRMEGGERERAERRFWWLADPLWSVPGNDRRTEHFARHVMDRLQDRAKSTEGISWGSDLREILLRYGWPVGWERIRPAHPMLTHRPSVVTHYAPRSWYFLPRVASLADPAALAPDTWRLEERAARSVYAPAYAAHFAELEHQVAVFRRGDSLRVVAAYALDPDSVPPAARTEAALVVMADAGEEPRVAVDSVSGYRGTLVLSAAPAPAVFSLEARTDSARVARARYGLRPPPRGAGVAVSDILFLEDADPLPTTLEEAAPRARGGSRVARGEPLGLFWEVYELPAEPDTLSFSLQVTREERGWMRRLAEGIGLMDPEAPVRVRWEEETTGEPMLARSLLLALPELPPGEYTLELSVARREGEPVVVTRALRVE